MPKSSLYLSNSKKKSQDETTGLSPQLFGSGSGGGGSNETCPHNQQQPSWKTRFNKESILRLVALGILCLHYSQNILGGNFMNEFARNLRTTNAQKLYNNAALLSSSKFSQLLSLRGSKDESDSLAVVVPYDKEYLNQTVRPGKHVFILPPESRIGPNGEIGYVQDPKWYTKHPEYPRELQLSEEVCLPPGQGFEKLEGYQSLLKIRNHLISSTASRNVSVLCAIYTHAGNVNKTNAILETWGKRCDGIFMASSVSNETTGHMRLPSRSENGFEYEGMYQRVRTMMTYLYDNFLNSDYDFFHFCGDDTYLIVDHLKEFLASERVQNWENLPGQYVFAGFWAHWGPWAPFSKTPIEGAHYFEGGPGYTLSRKALKAYVEGPIQKCSKLWTDKCIEDILFSQCLEEQLPQPKPMLDTRDEYDAHRYHHLDVYWHSTYSYPRYHGWDRDSQLMRQSLDHMERNFGYRVTTKQEYISSSSIAFHKHSADDLRRYELLLEYEDSRKLCGPQYDTATA